MRTRRSSSLLVLVLLILLQLGSATLAQAQESDARKLLAYVMNRHLAASYLNEIDRTAAWIDHIEGVAVMAAHEGWPTEKDGMMGNLLSFTYDVHNLEDRLDSSVTELNRKVQRNRVFTVDERARFDAILEDVEAMIQGSQDMFILLKDGRVVEAGEFYRTQTRLLFRKIQGDTFTMANRIENDLQKVRLQMRTLD